MKKILFTLGICFSTLAMYAQVTDQEIAEREIKRKYEQDRQQGVRAVDQQLDKLDSTDAAKRAGIQPFPTMSMTMQMEFPGKPKNNMSIDYFYKNYDCASVFHREKPMGMDRNIINFKEGTTTMLMTDKKGKKTGMVMDIKGMARAMNKQMEKSAKSLDNGDASLTPTEEYKTIEGYKCRKFLYEDSDYKSEMWLCNKLDMDYNQLNRAFTSLFSVSPSPGQNAYQKAGLNGAVIQMHMMPKDNKMEESVITMKNIKAGNVPEEMFSTAGYEITKMPTMRDVWNNAEKN